MTCCSCNLTALKLKIIHKCLYPTLSKTELNAMLRCNQILTVTRCEVTMQVKRDIHVGKTILQTTCTNILFKYMCVCLVSTLFGMICCLFYNCNKKNLLHGIDFYLCCKCATFLGARTHRNAEKRSSEICLL